MRSLENDAWHDQIAARRDSKRAFADGKKDGYREGWCDAIAKWQNHSDKLKAMIIDQCATIEAAANENTTRKGLLNS